MKAEDIFCRTEKKGLDLIKILKDLYILKDGSNNVLHMSDSKEILKTFAKPGDKISHLISATNDCSVVDSKSVIDFDIIENDKDKEYGYSEVSILDGKYDINMYQPRLCINNSYSEDTKQLAEYAKSYWAKADTVNGIISQHCRFWLRYKDADEIETSDANIPILKLSDEYKTMLLKTGFESDIILLAY